MQHPLKHALDTHICGAATKQAPYGKNSQEHNERIDRVARNNSNPVAFPDTTFSHGVRQPSHRQPQLAPGHVSNLCRALSHLSQGNLAIFLANRPASGGRRSGFAGIEQIFSSIDIQAFEPAGDRVYACRLVYDFGVRAAMNDPEELERLVPEPRALGYGVLVQVPEGLRERKGEKIHNTNTGTRTSKCRFSFLLISCIRMYICVLRGSGWSQSFVGTSTVAMAEGKTAIATWIRGDTSKRNEQDETTKIWKPEYEYEDNI